MSFCIHCGTKQLSEAKFCFSCGEIQPPAREVGGAVGTSFPKKCEILSFIWSYYREEEEYLDFAVEHDLGLAAAYLVDNNQVEPLEKAILLIDETWDYLLGHHGYEEDTGFDSFEEM